MASAEIDAEYISDALDFALELHENGHLASFGSRISGVDRSRPSGQYNEIGRAPVFPSEMNSDEMMNFSNDVKSNDRMFFVGAECDVENCRIMFDDDIEYKIIKVKPFKPAETIIFYEIQVRA